MKVRQLVAAALLGAMMIAAKYALDALPNIELVSLLVMLYTLCFPPLALPAIYTYVFLYGMLNGFGIWWIAQLYIWLVLYGVTRLLRKNNSVVLWAVVSGAFGLCYWALYALSYGITGGIAAGFAWWITGIPFDLMHCAGNVAVTLLLFRPLQKTFSRCNQLFF